ncbi:MAG: cytochrome c [Armatimonadota bacterium]|nr:cytochrome c [Armatimonadota bacterium]
MRSSIFYLQSSMVLTGVLLLSGCTRDHKVQFYSMWNGSRYKPHEPSAFFENGSVSQQPVMGTVPRGYLRTNDALYTGRSGGKLISTFPFPITQKVLERGQQRFNIYCAPCHGRDGRADGIVVQRGFSPPPDYRIDRLRKVEVGHFYDVITNGYGAMYSYASRVAPRDRWAIAAYIRVLQNSQEGHPPDNRTIRRNTPEVGAPGSIRGTAGGMTGQPVPSRNIVSGGMTGQPVPRGMP